MFASPVLHTVVLRSRPRAINHIVYSNWFTVQLIDSIFPHGQYKVSSK